MPDHAPTDPTRNDLTSSVPSPTNPVGVDELDVLIVDAMLLAALGPDSGALHIDRTGAEPVLTLTPLARNVLAETTASRRLPVHAAWLELLLPTLVEHTVDVLGEDGRTDAGPVCSRVALERAVRLGPLTAAAKTRPLTIGSAATVAATLAAAVLTDRMQRAA